MGNVNIKIVWRNKEGGEVLGCLELKEGKEFFGEVIKREVDGKNFLVCLVLFKEEGF